MYKNLSTLFVRKYYIFLINFWYLCVLQYICKTYNISQRHTRHLPVSIETASTWLTMTRQLVHSIHKEKMWTSSSNRCCMQWNLGQMTKQKWSWYQISQWHFQPLSSSTVMRVYSWLRKKKSLKCWTYSYGQSSDMTSLHSHTKSSAPLKLQCYILSIKDIINMVNKQLHR